ncbi:LPXTG cell wall anchor domain-containing protein [Enterococcus sp. MMGLQ5-2]|nr:LPXTG cell wall anchor domain-containing protein [Enterococcus sp. MMGLQ5-2]MBS7584048.1 LPXTG cell wall anchor domain-containing protein [Enterococcus sp. MMGLQ5-1]NPD11909.1 LPXTG cell wall anchor domain-containing protein [Enterococcus sp. MMGLQ5-1]NPD37588.1 LPXTG cell wall anchor domain-containing protein [Enterococcus sp. MMGLQ5-2]
MLPNTGEQVIKSLPYIGIILIVIGIMIYQKRKK